MTRLRIGLAVLAALFVLPAPVTQAQECSDVMSTLMAQVLSPVVENTPFCKQLRRDVKASFIRVSVGLDHTTAKLQSLRFCPGPASSRLTANVAVQCSTEPGAAVSVSIAEQFDIDVTVSQATCAIEAFTIQPRGEIGRVVAGLVDFQTRARDEVQKQISVICKR